jgi:hypothetical protein
MRARRAFVVLLAATATAVGAAAMTPTLATAASSGYHQSFSLHGVLADAGWSGRDTAQPGDIAAVAVFGADAATSTRIQGTRATRAPQASGLAFAIVPEEGAEPTEFWCVDQPGTVFTYAKDLSSARLRVDCDAVGYTYDPETGQEVPTGQTIAVEADVTWTATGPLMSTSHHIRDVGDGVWTMEVARETYRDASAHLVVSAEGLPAIDVMADRGRVADVKVGTLYFGPPPQG